MLDSKPQDFQYNGEPSKLIIGDENDFRENVVIALGLHAEGGTRIGDRNYFMDKVHICHDTVVHHDCVLGIGSVVAGECELDDRTILSTNVILNQHVHTGRTSLICSGCSIQKDVPPYIIMAGSPAAYHGVNAIVLEHYKTPQRILLNITNCYRLIYQGNFSLEDAALRIEEQVPMSIEVKHIINFIRDSKGITK